MAYVCDNCGKGVQYGGLHTHGRGVAGGRWKKKAPSVRKVFKPNLHAWHGMKLCTKCLRLLKSQVPVTVVTTG
ncbi:MAG: 50S ribosomal protein L28 [bacterium]|nr:50S ribosomal protein L28 [bacterium]